MFQRVSDVAYEDGFVRSPIAQMFYDLKLLSLEESLKPLFSVQKHFKKLVRISMKKARERKEITNLNDDMAAAIAFYSMEYEPRKDSPYFLLNESLREKDRAKIKPWRQYIWLLLHALNQLPSSGESILFRGAKQAVSDFSERYKKGNTISWSAFSSTSMDMEQMNSFVGKNGPRTVFHIQVRPWVAKSISIFSLFPTEQEVLLPPNLEFKVMALWNPAKDLTMIHLKQIKSDDLILQPSGYSSIDDVKVAIVEPEKKQIIWDINCPRRHRLNKNSTATNTCFCDACRASLAFGTVKYRCQLCDWDICKKCMKQNTSLQLICPGEHGLKKESTATNTCFCDKCRIPLAMGSVKYRCQLCDWDICYKCIKQQGLLLLICPGQHGLNKIVIATNTCICDKCEAPIAYDTFSYHCQLCNWDICYKCIEQQERLLFICPGQHGLKWKTARNSCFCDKCRAPLAPGTIKYNCLLCTWDICEDCIKNLKSKLPTCPGQHGLERNLCSGTYTCDKCDIKIKKDAVMYCCRKCNWDICETCFKM